MWCLVDRKRKKVNILWNFTFYFNFDIFICFALFNKGLKNFKRAYKDKLFSKIYTSDLIYLNKQVEKCEFVEVLDTGKLVSEVIQWK